MDRVRFGPDFQLVQGKTDGVCSKPIYPPLEFFSQTYILGPQRGCI